MSKRAVGIRRVTRNSGILGSLLLMSSVGEAQRTTLYDPQPPADAAYVRVIAAASSGFFDVLVRGVVRASRVSSSAPSPYLILSPGQQEIVIRDGTHLSRINLVAVESRAFTVVRALPRASPVVVEEQVNGNRLKAMVYVYNLSTSNTVDLWTADGNLRIVDDLPPHGNQALAVNPILLEFIVTPSGSRTPSVPGRIDMASGSAYTIVVGDGPGGRPRVTVTSNALERYRSQ